MKTEPGDQVKPAGITAKGFWKNEKFKEVFSGLKKNVLNKSKTCPKFFSPNISAISKLTDYPTAIDIGVSSVKFLQLENAAGTPAVKKIGISSKNSLSALINENQIQGRVSVSLPLSQLQVFSFSLPNMPEKEIEQAVIWKLMQNLPPGSDISSVSFDYNWRLYSGDNLNKEILALVFSAPKDKITQKINVFRGFSLEVAAIEPEPYAVFCALGFAKKLPPGETVLVLSLGASESCVTIAYDGFACLVRPLSVSGSSFTEAIANYHKFDPQKAESVKKTEGLKSRDSADAICMPALSGQIESQVVDLEHTFKFFSHQLMKSRVTSYDRVILCGGAAALKNLDKCLSEKLAVPVEVFNPLDPQMFASSRPLSPETKENGHSFAAAAGMAVRYLE